MKICKKCGAENPDQAGFCTVCGTPLAEQKSGKGRAGRIVLIVLLLMLSLGAGMAGGWWLHLRNDAAAFSPSASEDDSSPAETAGSPVETAEEEPERARELTGTLTGYAYEQAGEEGGDERISGAVISIQGSDGASVEPELAPDGTFTELLLPGDYTVSVRADGYAPAEEMAAVQEDEVTQCAVSMERQATAVTFTREYSEHDMGDHTGYFEYAVITGKDSEGNEYWSTRSEECGRNPHDVVFRIGVGDGVFYYVEGDVVVALSMTDGEVLWRSEHVGEIADAILAEDGNIYLCCEYDGPDFLGMSADGTVLGRIYAFDPPNTQGFDALAYESGFVKVHPCAILENVRVFFVDVSDYSYFSVDESQTEDFWTERISEEVSVADMQDVGEASEEEAYEQFLQDGGYFWEVTCLEDPEYALYDVDQDGTRERIIRGSLLNGYYDQDHDQPNYRKMFYSYEYTEEGIVYQGRQENIPIGCESAQFAEMEFTSFDLVYNYEFTEHELATLLDEMGAPSGVSVTDYKVSGGPNYWEGTNSWTINIEIWGSDGGYASTGLVLGTMETVHLWMSTWLYG